MQIGTLKEIAGATVIALMLAAAGSQPAFAATDGSRAGFYGAPPQAAAAGRVIEMKRDVRWINVTQNETVAIQRGDQVFNWTFSTWTTNSFDLAQIAPAGFIEPGTVRVYVAQDPRYAGS